MVQINFAQKQVNAKIVYYGPGMSGKTTNLEVIHQRAPGPNRGDLTSISTDGDRTLFFDFMPLDLGTVAGMRTSFQIYTVPGQVYYNSTRKLVLQGVDGVVFVADSSASMVEENLESFRNLEENLADYGKNLATMPHVIQYNKRDLPDALPVDELNGLLNKYNMPAFESVANTGQGVFPTLKALAACVLDTIHSSSGGGSAAQPAAPRQAAPQPVAPQPVAPQPVAPQPVAPQPVAMPPQPVPEAVRPMPAPTPQMPHQPPAVAAELQAPQPPAPDPMAQTKFVQQIGTQPGASPPPVTPARMTQTGFEPQPNLGAGQQPAQHLQLQSQMQHEFGGPPPGSAPHPVAQQPHTTLEMQANGPQQGAQLQSRPGQAALPSRSQQVQAASAGQVMGQEMPMEAPSATQSPRPQSLEGTRFRPRTSRPAPRPTPKAKSGGGNRLYTSIFVALAVAVGAVLTKVILSFF